MYTEHTRSAPRGFIMLTIHETGKSRRFAVAHIVGYQAHPMLEGVTVVDDPRTAHAVYDIEGVHVRETCEAIDALIAAAQGGNG